MGNYAFGIDLGTTNSCIAVKTPGTPAKIIPLADGNRTLPSCVMYKNGSVIVGSEAYNNRYDTKHVVYSSKRDIGSNKVYRVFANGDDRPPVEVTPVEVASEILKKLKHDAELMYGEGFIKDVTITVPAYFTLARRAATIEAARKAGLNVIALINEPTAAAIAYTEGKTENENILVYDLGGGTFDVTLLEMLEPDKSINSLFDDEDMDSMLARVVSSAGDPYLGGDDLDKGTYLETLKDIPAENLPEAIRHLAGKLDSYVTPITRERAILNIERKKKMGTTNTASMDIELEYEGASFIVTIYVSQEHYARALNGLYQRTLSKLKECLEGRSMSTISKLILIGGSTKLQILRDRITKEFKKTKIYLELNPDEAVALGAAVNSSILAGDTNMTVSDVLPQSIGIKITSIVGDQQFEGRYLKLIPKNTALPTSVKSVVTTAESMQTVARVPIYQGEDTIAENNVHVSDVVLNLEPSEDIQNITITMNIDASGILHIKLESGSAVTSAVVENILKPAANDKSKVEKLITRYRIMLNKYKNSSKYDEGMNLLDRFLEGSIAYSDVRKFFDDLTSEANSRYLDYVDSEQETDMFGNHVLESDDGIGEDISDD